MKALPTATKTHDNATPGVIADHEHITGADDRLEYVASVASCKEGGARHFLLDMELDDWLEAQYEAMAEEQW